MVLLCIFLLAAQNINCLTCIVIDASRVHSIFFHLEGVIYEIVNVTKTDQTGRDGGLFLWRCQKFERVICSPNQINEPIVNPTRALPVAMIHERVIFFAYGL
jgi:hypothetical protein